MNLLRDIIATGVVTALGPIGALYALTAIGLNVHYGYTGLLNFGQVGFMLVGAYGLAVSVAMFQLPFLVGVGVGIGLAILLALLLGAPTLRLRADYLAITTIAAAEILRFVTRSRPANDLTAGVFGIPSQFTEGRGFGDVFYGWSPLTANATYGFGWFRWSGRQLWLMIVAWAVVLLALTLIWALMRSPWGRVIKSIREDEDAARSLGKNVFVYKMQALVLGGVLGGLGGIAFALNQASVSPDAFLPQVTFYAYTVVILGGAATVSGPVLGSMIFWFLVAGTDLLLRNSGWFAGSGSIGAMRLALVGLGLMLLMIFRPQGILGNKREMMLDA
jgi:neutral amino acid transport system permease protein